MFTTILIGYLILSLFAGIGMIIYIISGDYIRIKNWKIEPGKVDFKFGPAWKSQMTYMIGAMAMMPVLNLWWVWCILRSYMED